MPTPADPPASTRYAGDRRRDAKRALYEGRYDDSWAVLIGIDHYQHYNPLRLAARDAVAMARALVEYRWFPREKVFLLVDPDEPLDPDPHAWLEPSHPDLKAWLDATRLGDRYRRSATKQQIEHVLFDELAAVKADDRVLIYFAGHGLARSPNDRPYLVPSDARPGWWREHIDLRDLLREGSYLRAKHVLYVLDACCAGLADSRSGEQDKPFVQKMLRRAARQCLTAGTREQRVDDQAGRHSPFTSCLLELLGDRSETGDEAATTSEDGKALPVSTIAARLKERVGNADTSSGQHPALFSTFGDRGGEFVFSPRVAPPSPQAQAALAGQLVDDVGRLLDEPAPIRFAARLWRRIARSASVAPGEQREAKREHARAQLLLGRPRAALRELDATLDHDPEARLLDAAKPPATVQAELGIATLVIAPYMQRPAEIGAQVEPLPQGAADRVDPARVEQLFKLLALRGGPSLTLAGWRRAFDDAQQQQLLQQQRLPVLQGSRLRGKSNAALLPYLATRDRVFELLQGVEHAALPGMLDRLKQLTSQPEDVAEAWLMIAIIEAQQGNHTRAIEAVDPSLGRDPAVPLDPLGSRRGATAGDSPEARYHRGRIQLACHKYTEAEADLQFTVDRESKHARAHYHRARAIRALLETDLEQRRRESIHAYMKNGAPFGIDGEVTEQRPDPSTRTQPS